MDELERLCETFSMVSSSLGAAVNLTLLIIYQLGSRKVCILNVGLLIRTSHADGAAVFCTLKPEA